MLDFLPGKKTYIVGGLMVVWGLASAFLPDLGAMPVADDPMTIILEGFGLMGLRRGVQTVLD